MASVFLCKAFYFFLLCVLNIYGKDHLLCQHIKLYVLYLTLCIPNTDEHLPLYFLFFLRFLAFARNDKTEFCYR